MKMLLKCINGFASLSTEAYTLLLSINLNIMKWICLFLILGCLMAFRLKDKGNEYIVWSDGYKLTWEDFKGKPIMHSSFKAITCYSISYETEHLPSDSLQFNITANFNKSKSWTAATQSHEELLKHEQLHFDISELYARKFRRQVSESKFHSKTLYAECAKISSENRNACSTVEDQYDAETKHSQVKFKQQEWETRIAKELQDLEEYNAAIVKVRLRK